MAELKDRIKQLRKEKGLTQIALSDMILHGKTAVSVYESGTRTPMIADAMQLASIFDVSLEYLTGRSDIRVPYKLTEEDLQQWEKLMSYLSVMDERDFQHASVYAEWLLDRQNKNQQ